MTKRLLIFYNILFLLYITIHQFIPLKTILVQIFHINNIHSNLSSYRQRKLIQIYPSIKHILFIQFLTNNLSKFIFFQTENFLIPILILKH